MARLFRHIRAPMPDEPIDVSDVRPQKHASYKGFTEEEAAMIEDVCGEANQRSLADATQGTQAEPVESATEDR